MENIEHNIIIERDNPNDEEVILTKKTYQSGDYVETGAVIAEIESSKVNLSIESDKSGYIVYMFNEGDTISIGEIFAKITNSKDEINSIPKTKSETNFNFTLTKKAEEFVKQNNINEEDLINLNLSGIVSLDQLKAIFNSDNSIANKKAKKNIINISANHQAVLKTISKSKEEIIPAYHVYKIDNKILSNKIKILTKKHKINITDIDLFIYYFSKIMKDFKKMNSVYINDSIIENDEISAGVIFTHNDELFNITILDTDKKTIEEICTKRNEIFLEIARGNLHKNFFKKSSFSISMIKNSNLILNIPIVYPNNSFIVGIGGNYTSKESLISIAFDHRLVNGSYVSEYMNDVLKNLANNER